MSDELKPKIDLKARLGKRAVQTQEGAASIPPPIGLARPAPQAYGAQPQGAPRPMGPMGSAPFSQPPQASPSNPYASSPQQAPAMRAEPMAIRVEMGEEVLEQRKRSRSKMLVGMGIVAVLALGAGYAVGGQAKQGSLNDAALEDAKVLIVKVKKANDTAEQLDSVLTSAISKFKEQKFPTEEVSKLGEINIAFTELDLPQSIGRFKDARPAVLKFLQRVEETNERKESLQNILSSSKEAFEQLLADRVNPKVKFAAVVAPGSDGPWLQLALVSDPFLVKEAGKSWPSLLKVKRVQEGKLADGELNRISKMELKSDMALPVDPATQGLVCPASDIIGKMRSELGKLQESLNGDETAVPEKEGLKKLGKRLKETLEKLGGSGAG